MANDMWLLEAQPYDPVTAAVVNVYLAKRTTFFNANDGTAPNRTYRGWLSQALTCGRGMEGLARLLGYPASQGLGAAVLTVGDEFAAKRTLYKRYRWATRSVQIYQGPAGAARSAYTKRFDGVFAAQPSFEKQRVALPIADLLDKLDQPFQSATYSGAGGFNGGADLKGQHKPDGVGVVRGAAGKWVDQANGWLDVCASGFHTVYQVTDGANILTVDAANPPAAGKYYIDAVNGRLRFGSLPTYGYRVDFRSNFAAGSRLLGTIAKEIFSAGAGFSSGQIDSAAFTTIDTDRPEIVGWYAPDGESMREGLDYLLGGALCFYTTTPAKVTAGLLSFSIATVKTDPTISKVITDRDIIPGSLILASLPAPPHTLNVQARRNWGPLTDDQIAAGAAQADKDFARQEWRTIPKANATTLSEFPQALPMDWATPFDDLTEAGSFGDGAKDMLTVPRQPAEVRLAIAPFGIQPGQHVWIESAVNEVDGPATVVHVDEDEDANEVKLTLAGLAE